ncbi:helix-turn-helix domain-containing protein, partial [Candidatus Pacearchaeota archaeon]|nr:helix-turn-helix domain-containing protein [Candidatus Pacearchaeota archaeon]
MDIEKSLKEYGLSENEVKIYLTLIKAGESTVQIIAKNAGLPRTTVYHILDKLLDKSLVGF